MFFRPAVDRQPKNQPKEANRAGGDECRLPAIVKHDPGHSQGNDDRSEI